MKNLILLSAVAIILSLASCSKTENVLPSSAAPVAVTTTPAQPTKTEQLKVASDFNWKTFKDVELTLTGTANSIVQVVSANQTVYQKAYLSKDQAYTMKLSVPSTETSVHLLYQGQDVNINLNASTIAYKFN
jgi:hypothetical protein